uniref:Very-long-chain (3R)-3-hydroxyacyl-CoA dehydratase n=1 Tax=Panagrolaimus sp. JU765 TaxID=591449 RepID=A0AC34QGJ5_9BILA
MRDASNVESTSDGKKLSFSADGHAGQGKKRYGFDLEFVNEVSKDPSVKITGSQVDIELKKKSEEFWSTLTPGKRAHWLKFDFSRWKDPEGDSEPETKDNFDFMSDEEKIKDWAKKYGKSGSSKMTDEPIMDFVTKFYLFAFNVLMFLVHFYVLACLAHGYWTKGSLYFGTFWKIRRLGIYTTTVLQYMDVIHGCIGLTKSGWKTGLIQVTGRLVIIALVDGCPDLQTSVSTFCLMFVYFLIEQFRYPYYAVSSLGLEVYFLTWLRYSIWIILYPSGLILEAISMFKAIPFFYYSQKWSISLPNFVNFSFNFGVFLAIFVTTAFPKNQVGQLRNVPLRTDNIIRVGFDFNTSLVDHFDNQKIFGRPKPVGLGATPKAIIAHHYEQFSKPLTG